MSIRRVNCPACKAAANIPATMTNVKCPSCGQVWNVNNPEAAAPAARRPKATAQAKGSNGGNAAVIAVVSGAVVLLAIVGIALVLFLPQADKEPAEKPASSEIATAEPAVVQPPSYREVDLPESTRRKIYSDYRRMAMSSIEKKLMIPKDSPVRNSVEGMLTKTVDREITHFALENNISEEDVMQIVAEGDAKQWPGSRKQAASAATTK